MRAQPDPATLATFLPDWPETEARALARVEPEDQVVGPTWNGCHGGSWLVVIAPAGEALRGDTRCILLTYGPTEEERQAGGRLAERARQLAAAPSSAAPPREGA